MGPGAKLNASRWQHEPLLRERAIDYVWVLRPGGYDSFATVISSAKSNNMSRDYLCLLTRWVLGAECNLRWISLAYLDGLTVFLDLVRDFIIWASFKGSSNPLCRSSFRTNQGAPTALRMKRFSNHCRVGVLEV